MEIVLADSTLRYNGRTPDIHPLGGSQSALVYVARELVSLGHKVTVYNLLLGKPQSYDGVEYRPLSAINDDRNDRVDVIVANRDPRILVEWNGSGTKILRLQDNWDQPLVALFKSLRIRLNVDHVFCVSEWQKKSFCHMVKWSKKAITTMPNGFWRPHFSDTFPEPVGNRLTYCSTPYRGLGILLDVFPYIITEVPDAELHVYSDMKMHQFSDDDELEVCGLIYEKLDQPGVVNHGSVGQKELATELGKCRVFAYSNVFAETSCISAMEAQAAGCVVVTSNLGALPETVGPNGIIVPGEPGSESYNKHFIEECVKLLRDEDAWRDRATKAREWITENNTWQVLAPEWVKAMETLKRGRKRCLL